jgi:hypothetical protein
MVSRQIAEVPLPFDRSCPVIYTNNGPGDCYTDEYLLALASAGDLKLRGIITSADKLVEECNADRLKLLALVRRAGMKNFPDPVIGPLQPFQPPPSEKIDETRPWGSPGGRLIVAEARKASPKKPLVVLCGGYLGAVADAYLLDPSIADRVVVAFNGGAVALGRDWAMFIVLERMRTVLTGPVEQTAQVSVSSGRWENLPEGALREAMKAKNLKFEYTSLGIIAAMRTDFCLKTKRKSLMPWPAVGATLGMVDDPKGKLLMITEADRNVAIEEFWRALEKPSAWGQQPK